MTIRRELYATAVVTVKWESRPCRTCCYSVADNVSIRSEVERQEREEVEGPREKKRQKHEEKEARGRDSGRETHKGGRELAVRGAGAVTPQRGVATA